MERIRRRTSLTEGNEIENRVAALERRYVSMPTGWAVASFDVTPQPVSSGGTILEWEAFRSTTARLSTTATIGGAVNNTAGDKAIRLDGAGIVLVTTSVRFENGTFYRHVVVNGTGGETDAISNLADIQDSAAFGDESVDTDGSPLAFADQQWFQNGDDTFAGWFTAQANMGAAQPDKDAISASLTVVLFQPSGVPWDNTVVY